MILLDTNIVSELMRPVPDTNVLAWIDDPELPEIATTAISLAEIGYGIAMLPEGRRKRAMQDAVETFFRRRFGSSTMPFDTAAAALYAELARDHRRAGRPVGILDLQIAAIAKAHGAAIATRNTRHFASCGIVLIDPFAPTAAQ